MSSGEGIIDSSLNPLSQSSFINQIGQLELLSSLKSTQGSSENNNYSKNVNNIKTKNNGNNDNNYRHNKEDRNNDNLSPIINPTPNPNNDDNRNQDNNKKQKAVFKIVMPSSRSSSKITKSIIKPINSNNTNIKPTKLITNTVANVNSTDSKSNKITKTTATKKCTTRTNKKKTNNSLSGATRTNATPLIDKNGIFSDLKVLFIPKKIDKVRLGLMKSKVMAKEIKDKNKLKMIQFGKVLDVEPFLVHYMDQVNNNNNRDKNSKSILTSTQAHMKRNHEEPGKQQESLIVTAATATMTSSSLPIECNIFQDPLTEMIFEAKKLQENKNVAGEINSNPNKDIIQKLQILYEHYERMKDHWRMLSYRKAIAALKKYNKPITSYEEARNIFGIGERTAQKIMEIIETGRLQRIENLDEDDELIKKFIGNTLAMKWHAKGYRTFEDLLQNAKLTSAQRAGIIYYDDLQERIPRNEVTEISMCIERLAHTVDKNLECITVGSYRRGSSSCGDIDIMITKNDSKGKNHLGILSKLLPILRRESIIVHDLAQHHGKESLSERYRGICKLPGGKNRRLDLFTVPYNEIGAALLSYTGNDLFNRSMRLLARKKKMRLNHHGLYGNIIRGNGAIKYSEGTLIAQKTEIEIFDALGVPYRSPGERNC
ncbi:12154_t:CDS:10 [Entrophospora sp. SA101]|nr:12154_t:CDS:10 [Entrophospora sp. SA101]